MVLFSKEVIEMKIELTKDEVKNLQKSEVGRAYLEYNEKVGGEPIELFMPSGYPGDLETEDDVIKAYKECIAKGVTWEDLLDYHMPDDAIL